MRPEIVCGKLYWSRRKRAGAIVLIAVGVLSIYAGLSLRNLLPQPASPKPGGGGGAGNGGGTSGGGQGGGTADTEAPSTSITIVGYGYTFSRAGVWFYSGNFTVSLNATDDQTVARISLQDNGTTVTLPTLTQSSGGHSAWASTMITGRGLHMLQYYSTDKVGNAESPQSVVRGISKPSLSDLSTLIGNSGVDNAGIKNALLSKVVAAEGEQTRGASMNSLNALVNQLNALDGKHGLDSATVANIEAMILAIIAP